MEIKAKYADIKAVYDWFDKFADDKIKVLIGTQPTLYEYAYYTPSQANWSYRLGLIIVDGVPYRVVTVFGAIRCAMPANIRNYTSEELEKTRC